MSSIGPDNFTELLGGFLVAVAVLFSMLSLTSSKRTHGLKVFAICAIAGMAFISNHPATYFAAIFIIATAVTELEFLQNLAAIIRGNKEYFNYKIEQLSREEKRKSIAEELEQAKGQSGSVKLEKPLAKKSDAINRYMRIEELALDKLSKILKKPILNSVRVESEGRMIEFDGIVTGKHGRPSDEVIEVKYISSEIGISSLTKIVQRLSFMLQGYSNIIGEEAKLHLVFVFEGDSALRPETKTELIDFLESNINLPPIQVHTFTTSELDEDAT